MWPYLFVGAVALYIYRESAKLPKPAVTYNRKEDEPLVPVVPVSTGEIQEEHSGPFAAATLSTPGQGMQPIGDVPTENYPDLVKHLNYINKLKHG